MDRGKSQTMNEISSNLAKHDRYTELIRDLKKAILYHFYLEAIFIEYAILEDRTKSILMHSKRYNENKHDSLSKKVTEILVLIRQSSNRLSRYLSIETVESIRSWMKNRNALIHHLPQISCCEDDVMNIALEGVLLVKKISNASTSFRRYTAQNSPL